MKILMWDLRGGAGGGAAKPSFHSTFKKWMQLRNPNVCILLETRFLDESFVRAGQRFSSSWGFYAIESLGMAGCIIVVWKTGMSDFDIFYRYIQHVSLLSLK